jgi:pimeloyl-ACP methyl ester carboxylesterase
VEPVLGRLFLLAIVVVSIGAPPARAMVERRADFTKLDTKVMMSDGAQIAVTFYEPAGTPPAGGWPAVMMFHGLGQTRNTFEFGATGEWSANHIAETYLVPDGYAVLTFDARAHGESGGLFSLDGPRELQDTRELFTWLTSHPDVDAQRIGAFGVSYGGGMVWLAAVNHIPFRTIAVAATWTDLHQALAPQNFGRAGIVLGFAQDLSPDKLAPGLADLLKDAYSGTNVQALRAFLAERSTRPRLHTLKLPVLMLQGRRDFAFDADQALAAFRLLRGPKRLYFGNLGHLPAANPPAELPHDALETRAWFDRFLKGVGNGMGKRPQVELAADPWTGKTVTYNGLPPTRTLRFSLDRHSTLTAAGKVVRTFARVPHIETFGTPTVRIQAASRTGYAHLAVVLSALPPHGSEIVIADGGAATPQLGSKLRTLTIHPQDEITAIPRGSRLRVMIGATSTVQSIANIVYLNPVEASSVATIRRVTLTLPVLKKPVSP